MLRRAVFVKTLLKLYKLSVAHPFNRLKNGVKAMAGEEPSNRSENGQFSKGNAGGPGRPKREVERNYLEQFKAVCGPPEWERIIKRAVEDAATGDGVARAWLSKHLVGVPIIKTSEPNTIGELLADIPYEQRDRLLEVLEREFGKGG